MCEMSGSLCAVRTFCCPGTNDAVGLPSRGDSFPHSSELVYRLRIEAGLTQVELADRMGTAQPAIARMENGGVRPTLDTLEKLAKTVGKDLVGIGEGLQENRTINKMVRDGHAVVRPAI